MTSRTGIRVLLGKGDEAKRWRVYTAMGRWVWAVETARSVSLCRTKNVLDRRAPRG